MAKQETLEPNHGTAENLDEAVKKMRVQFIEALSGLPEFQKAATQASWRRAGAHFVLNGTNYSVWNNEHAYDLKILRIQQMTKNGLMNEEVQIYEDNSQTEYILRYRNFAFEDGPDPYYSPQPQENNDFALHGAQRMLALFQSHKSPRPQ